MNRCYNEETDYELDDLGDDAWLTGCPLCGGVCWDKTEKEIARIDKELDEAMGLIHDEVELAGTEAR